MMQSLIPKKGPLSWEQHETIINNERTTSPLILVSPVWWWNEKKVECDGQNSSSVIDFMARPKSE
jgi:hypothetical protein